MDSWVFGQSFITTRLIERRVRVWFLQQPRNVFFSLEPILKFDYNTLDEHTDAVVNFPIKSNAGSFKQQWIETIKAICHQSFPSQKIGLFFVCLLTAPTCMKYYCSSCSVPMESDLEFIFACCFHLTVKTVGVRSSIWRATNQNEQTQPYYFLPIAITGA